MAICRYGFRQLLVVSEHSIFGALSVDDFLKEYWQKKPLLVRQAFPTLKPLIEADELAGLALEEWVESRLINSETWTVEHGPFQEERLSSLPTSPWTLLVQGVDQLNTHVADLLKHFHFLPTWRLDDVMVSFATNGGGVGPHFDHYDVFLVQGEGKRRWQIGQTCEDHSPLLVNTELKILKEFNSKEDYTLETGDMLYLPPKLAHWGTAIDNCITYSIGFRAPSSDEILDGICSYALDRNSQKQRYTDNFELNPRDPFSIPPEVINQLRSLIESQVNDTSLLANWFGEYMTHSRYNEVDVSPIANENLIAGKAAYFSDGTNDTLFVDGEAYTLSKSLAKKLCESEPVSLTKVESWLTTDSDRQTIKTLIQNHKLNLTN